ncbi:MAG: hypothetical protein Ct9H90mP16_02670 [Candidatus Poseidoniales archaeon]|nr:MAG: hypothetical protein Ct9H90mP16_02670 [Candidatus Poseidoniales archaeon]
MGNTFGFFITLTALLVGSIVQKEILERKYQTGPHIWTANSLPEGFRRGLLSVGFALLGFYWLSEDAAVYLWATSIFCSVWAAYGVYRTILAAKTPPTHKDMM